MAYMNVRLEDYVYPWLTMFAYNGTYDYNIQPTQGQRYWEKIEHVGLVPLIVKILGGRPKRQSRKDGTEIFVSPIKESTCCRTLPKYGSLGHYARSCPN